MNLTRVMNNMPSQAVFLIAITAYAGTSNAVPPTGTIVRIAGSGGIGYSGDGGPASAARFRDLSGLALSVDHHFLYAADSANHVIRQIALDSGRISTIAGRGRPGYSGDGGYAVAAALSSPMSIAVDTAGNLLIADTGNNAIRFINHATGLISTIAGTATTAADADITLGDGGPARSAVLWNPRSIILDKDSNVYIADTYHHKIRMIDGDGVITTVAGTGIAGCAGDGLVATDAELNLPAALAVNQAGDIAIADAHVIRLIAHDTHRIETLAGMNECEDSTSSRSGSAIGETLLNPMGLSFDKSGQILYVSDSLHNLVRQINLSTRAMTTAAGIEPGRMVASNGSISATDVAINIPVGLAVDSGGALYIAQAADSRISFVSFPSAPPSKPPSVCTVQTGRTNKALHSFVIQAYCQ